MARNRTPGCPPLPSLITQHSWGAACRCATGAGVRLAQGQVTVIDRRMTDGCSWRSGSVFNCCWIGHFSPCKHVLRGASGWMTARRWKRRQTVSVKRGWAVEPDWTDRTSGCLAGLLQTEGRPLFWYETEKLQDLLLVPGKLIHFNQLCKRVQLYPDFLPAVGSKSVV